MKLLARPQIIVDANGKTVLQAHKARNEWSAVLTCGEHGPGCGAKQEVQFVDVYKQIIDHPHQRQIGYRTRCLHCYEDIPIRYDGNPWSLEDVPTKSEWAHRYAESLINTLYEESTDREDLFVTLVEEDGIDPAMLLKLNWN